MKRDPRVSVIIPTYNSAPTIIQAIEGVLKQTFSDLEVIVVDDGSTDNTHSVLEGYIQSGKIKYLLQNNKGCGAARNTGATIAQGEYIAFLDADDYWHPEKIKKQLIFLDQHPECVMCYTETFLVFPNGRIVLPQHTFLGKPRSGYLLKWLAICNMINYLQQ